MMEVPPSRFAYSDSGVQHSLWRNRMTKLTEERPSAYARLPRMPLSDVVCDKFLEDLTMDDDVGVELPVPCNADGDLSIDP